MSMSKYEVLLQRVEEVLNLSLPAGSPDKAIAAFDGMKQLYKAIWDISMWHSHRKPMRLRACGAKQPGWYWLDNTSGISINIRGDSVLIKGHYDPTVGTHPELVQNITTFVPAAWLGVDGMRTLWSRVPVVDNDGNAVQLPFAIKALHIWGTTDLRELFNKLMQDKTLQFYVSDSGGLASYEIAQNMGFVKAEHNMKGLKGRAIPDTDHAFNIVKEFDDKGIETGIRAYEDPSKLNERFVKIFGNSDGVFVGKWKVVVVMDRIILNGKDRKAQLYQQELDNAFCTGTAYSKGMFRFIGPSRLVTKLLGGKLTNASSWQFDGFDDHTVVANCSTWKGGLNCLLAQLGIMSQKDQVKFCDENPDMTSGELTEWAIGLLKDKGLIKTKRIKYRGKYATMTYVETEEDFYATNLYVLYGCQYKEEAEVDTFEEELAKADSASVVDSTVEIDPMDLFTNPGDVEAVEPEALSCKGSYYTTSIKSVVFAAENEHWDFNLNAQVMEDEKLGVIVKSAPVTSFSVRELSNYFWSYAVKETGKGFNCTVDMEDMNSLMYRVVKHNDVMAGKRHKDMQNIFVNGRHSKTVTIGIEELCDAVAEIFSITKSEELLDGSIGEIKEDFSITERGWYKDMDGLSRLSHEEFVAKWRQLIGGFGSWPGLGKYGILVKVEDSQFYIPGYKFLKGHILPMDRKTYDPVSNPESLFGDAMQTIMMLFVAAREYSKGKKVNWAVNAAQHLIRMNSAMFEDKLNRMICAGTYLTIAPKFWGIGEDGYISSITAVAAPEGHIAYSKDPILFDKAFTGVMNSNCLPEDLFTDLTDSDLYGMRSICFVNTELLLRQENDSDGDMVCVRYAFKPKLYSGQWRCMQKRVDKYIWGKNEPGVFGDGERNYSMKFKRWTRYTKAEIAKGIHANRCAKENISLMTASLYQHAMMLEYAVLNGYIKPFWAKMLWSLYGYIVQDEAMRMIKHSEGNATGQSDYYHATSVFNVVMGDWETMYLGQEERDIFGKKTGKRNGAGFLNAIEKYWDEFDPTNNAYKTSLAEALRGYVAGVQNLLHSHKAIDEKGNARGGIVAGDNIGRFKNASNTINLALDLANGKCATGLFKLHNVLQRGYFRHVETNRIMISKANMASGMIKELGLRMPIDGAGVVRLVEEVAEGGGYKFPSIQATSLAYILDEKVRRGWMQQHTYVGMGHTISASKGSPVCVMWLEMIKLSIPAKKLKKAEPKKVSIAPIETKAVEVVDDGKLNEEFANIISSVLDDIDSFGNVLYPSSKK